MAQDDGEQELAERPIGELVKQLSEQTSSLARKEIELAKAELALKAKRAGIGAGMFGGAGLLGLFALGALTAAMILGLSEALGGWLAALIVAAAYAAVAGILALTGKSKVQQATPPVPQETVESVKEDVEWAKMSAKRP